MKITLNDDWYRRMAELEGDSEIGAGAIAVDPSLDSGEHGEIPFDEGRMALSRFIKLMRRQRKLAMEELAAQADIEIIELMTVEAVIDGVPGPRTLFKLAESFGVSYDKLMGLSGLVQVKENNYLEESVRFAARSESLDDLTAVEQEALESMLSVLSESN